MAKNLSAVIITGRSAFMQKRPKASLPFGDLTVLQKTMSAYAGAGFDEILLVLSSKRESYGESLGSLGSNVRIVEAGTGDDEVTIGSQLRAGAEAVSSSAGGFAIGLHDQPLLSADLVKEMVEKFRDTKKKILVPTCQGSIGLPAFFDSSLTSQFKKLSNEDTAWDVLKTNGDEVEDAPYAYTSVIRNIDDVDDYHSLLAIAKLPVPETENESDDEMARAAHTNGASPSTGASEESEPKTE